MRDHANTTNDPIRAAIEQAEEVDAASLHGGPGEKPRLLIQDASPDVTVAALRDVLAKAGGLYDRGTPVRLYVDIGERVTKAQHLRGEDLVLHAHGVSRPYRVKPDKTGENRDEDVRLPRTLAEMYLGWQGEWQLPPLNGITRAPLLHDDGTVHVTTGYDPKTGIWCEAAPDIAERLPASPSREDALAALRTIRNTFRTFCFADTEVVFDPATGVNVIDLGTNPGLDESSFLAALLTAVCRASLDHAPGVLVRAAAMSGAGAGKGLLVRCIAIVAFGREPHAVSGGSTTEELEKRIGSELIEANPILFLDNLNERTFKSASSRASSPSGRHGCAFWAAAAWPRSTPSRWWS